MSNTTSTAKLTAGELSWGSFFSRKRHTLKEGATIVGREDPHSPSDIQFDDPEMSRRSVCIEATPTAQGYIFHLTVLKATNPVLINNKPAPVGTPVQLSNGAVVKLGKTAITFKINR